MDKKEIQAWRTIVAILRETGYDKLYDEEVHIVAECLRRCEQQCKEQKEVIYRIKEYIEKFIPIDEDTILMREKQRDYLLDILQEVLE